MSAPSFSRGNTGFRSSSGFTLIEIIISIVLIGILAAVGASMMSDSFKTTRMVNANAASNTQARYTLERLAREIREIKVDTPFTQFCIPSQSPANMSATKLSFYKTNGTYNNTCATNTNLVTINYANPNLTLAYTYSSHPPADVAATTLNNQVTAFTLTYFDANNSQLTGWSAANIAAVNFVVINMTVQDATSGQSTQMRTRVVLRNAP